MIGIWYVIGWSTCSATWLFTPTRCGCKEDTMEGSVSPGWFGFRWQRMVAEDLQIPFEPSLGEGHSVGSESQNYPRRIGLNSHISPSIHPVLPVPNRDFADFPIFSPRPTQHPTQHPPNTQDIWSGPDDAFYILDRDAERVVQVRQGEAELVNQGTIRLERPCSVAVEGPDRAWGVTVGWRFWDGDVGTRTWKNYGILVTWDKSGDIMYIYIYIYISHIYLYMLCVCECMW